MDELAPQHTPTGIAEDPHMLADRIRKQGREKKLNKFDQSGLSMEELEKIQAEQFAAAAARHN